MKKLITLLFIVLGQQVYAQNLQLVGSTAQMIKNFDLSANIDFDTLSNTENLYGIGAIENLQGEMTIINGKPYVATWSKDNQAQIEQTFNKNGIFLVSANVKEWKEIEINQKFNDKSELLAYVLKQAEKNDLDVDGGFPFRIETKVDHIRAHISFISEATIQNFSPQAKKADDHRVIIENEDVEIIGFAGHQAGGRFAMPAMPNRPASKMHIHFLTADQKKIGHIEDLKILQKAVLYLPQFQQ